MTATPMTTAGLSAAATAYLEAVHAPGVSAQRVEWISEVKPAAAHKGRTLTKRTQCAVMTGVEYANLSENVERETGELPWGEWLAYPYVIGHKGTEYARLYVVDGTITTMYAVDGAPVDRDTFLSYLTPSQREAKRPTGGTITVKIKNLAVVR